MKALLMLVFLAGPLCAAVPRSWSGIYPSLAFFNEEGECGTGAVVPWAGRLWVITYGPHLPYGSTDKLYEISEDLTMSIRPESVGGTPANRMIHRESGQLLIGPYLIDERRKVRVISPKLMPGRLTGNARHLTDPAGKVYYATMEEGLYEVDVKTLKVTGLIKDGNGEKAGYTQQKFPATVSSKLPGYHGKGLYSGQGRVVYANNGERGAAAESDPRTPSGALGEWMGEGDWKLVRRNQFTEVTGPNGIEGSKDGAKDPIWSTGWDSKSLILMMLDGGSWHSYRLPKASHCYDGAHGWNTEWPRIRDIGEKDLLMTMHGMFWKFPRDFSVTKATGIRPRSTYLKVVGDFCEWNGRLVFGCDDTAKSAFLNSKNGGDVLASPGQSQSNLWFTKREILDELGPVLGRGAVWLREAVKSEAASDPYLFAGYGKRVLFLEHKGEDTAEFVVEVDVAGDGKWKEMKQVKVPAGKCEMVEFSAEEKGEWIRLRSKADVAGVTGAFIYSNGDARKNEADARFTGLAGVGDDGGETSGWLRARGKNRRTLLVSMAEKRGEKPKGGLSYELDGEMKLRPLRGKLDPEESKLGTALVQGSMRVGPSAIEFRDTAGAKWLLPRGAEAFDGPLERGNVRVEREVSTERFLLNCHGTFYELPSENAGGISKVRPVASHDRMIGDFASYRGLLVMTGVNGDTNAEHIIRSDDGKAAVWVGTIDDLWKLGKPVGKGGPWLKSEVKAGEPSAPYLFAGYDQKTLSLSHDSKEDISFRVELDITGEGDWVLYQDLAVKAGEKLVHAFPPSCQAYWVRVSAGKETVATAEFDYH